MSTLDQKTFIGAIRPFNSLPEKKLDEVMAAMDIAYYKPGHVLLEPGQAPENLFLVLKGLVQERNENGDVISMHGPQDTFDAIALLEGKTENEFIVQQELICHVLPKIELSKLIQEYPEIHRFYYQNLSARLNDLLEQRHLKEISTFMVAKIREAYVHPPLFVDANASIYEAVKTMKAHKTHAILVRKAGQVGIMTEADVSRKLVLQRLSVDEPVDTIASYDVISLSEDDFLFNAKLMMTKYSIKHLVVCNGKEMRGILQQSDVLSYFADHSGLIDVQIERAANLAQLREASEGIIHSIQSLFAKGVKLRYISQLVSELNKKIFAKLYNLIMPQEIVENSCLIVMGSEGREEQLLKTDQDNAIILRDGFQHPDLKHLTQKLTSTLLDFGYPPCPGDIMVSNSQWCQSVSGFKENIFQWLDTSNEETVMNIAIFYDSTAVAGDSDLLAQTKGYLYQRLLDNAAFFSRFARAAQAFETPLSWFEKFVVEKSQHKNQLDIKKGGIFSIVHGVRSLSIEYKIPYTNTISRIKALHEKNVFNKQFSVDLIEAFAFMGWLRLQSGLNQINNGEMPDNYITPNQLNKMERDVLKDAFKIVENFKRFLTHHYKLNMLG